QEGGEERWQGNDRQGFQQTCEYTRSGRRQGGSQGGRDSRCPPGGGTEAGRRESPETGGTSEGSAGEKQGGRAKKDSPKAGGCQHSGKACSWEVYSEARDGSYGQPGYSACFITRSAPAGYRAGSLALPDFRALTGCVSETLQTVCPGAFPRYLHRRAPVQETRV
ncbi:MAG: hypothetical protein WCS09_07260, partial [Pseudomonadota bacterium]